jgi:exodeoxyribonuclease-3
MRLCRLIIKEIGVFKLASWNVNSLTVRCDQVLDWLKTSQTHVLALQETKMVDERFPVALFEAEGYHVCFSGQKTYNGVAIISREPLLDVVKQMPDFVDEQRRVIAATIQGVRLINLYVPNGAAVGTDKYEYKLTWLKAVTAYIKQQLSIYPEVAVVGDFNIAPEDRDVHDPALWAGSVLVSPAEREAFRALLDLGLVDSFRTFTPEAGHYSWWDYRAGGFRRNHGMRIDLVLLSEPLGARCIQSGIDIVPRRAERPSDHTPVWVEFGA